MEPVNEKRVVLGTAGHIDHGKSSLVRALTGTDPDRLKEEKERGITIELGFAHLALPSGIDLSIVDVPGHERFVRNMVAGASGIDLVMLVVAADEGVMPQTREHLDICSLLRVKGGLVALTKADLVDEELLELAQEDVSTALAGSFLEGAPVVPVSANTGQGLGALVDSLDALARTVPQRGTKGLFRLPVDRVFTMRGFGTVVTGTVISGAVRKDEEVEVLPRGRRGKVRGAQVHGRSVDRAAAGQRTALNLSGLEVADLHRGDTVVHVGSLETTHMLDVRLDVLPGAGRPLTDRDRVRLHIGTQEVPVVVALLEGDELWPGEGGYAQLRSPARVVACPGDRFVLRQFSPAHTLGGGAVLDHRPRRHRGRRSETLASLERLESEDPAERLEVFLSARGPAGLGPQEVQAALGVPLEEARQLLQGAARGGWALVTDRKGQRHHHSDLVAGLEARALEVLGAYHADNPLKRGLGVEELRTKFPRYIGPRLVEFVLGRMAEAGRVVLEGDLVRRSDFSLRLSADDESLRGRIQEMLAARGYEAPSLEDAAAALGEEPKALRPVLDYLVGQGVLHRTKEGFYFESRRLEELGRRVAALLEQKGEMAVSDVKDLTGTTRKYTVPLLEYLDSQKVTVRKGDVRVLGPRGRG
ncbi:MAG: selenocysteine-specific translation elongation factor [Deferrisomatales bacterium]|nr:selenocysteine-specific translation elongation factor [Deferrisomatales bacterium]